jgi:predicted nucleic acid-binding protein
MSALLASSGKRSPSLVDCVSFEIIRKSAIDRAFAYDHHFEDRGFKLVGK